MKPMTKKEYIADHVKRSDESLAEHIILTRGPGERIVVGKPDRSEYRCTLMLAQSYLVLVGDLDTMVWAHCPYAKIEQAISWMSTEDVGYYVLQKAQIGMGSVGCESYIPEVALQQAMDMAADESENENGKKWSSIVDYIQESDHNNNSLDAMVYETFDDCEMLGMGMCPSPRLLWAWSIVRKANELLKEAECPSATPDREGLGCYVRQIWIDWASEQPDVQAGAHPNWLTPWEDLDERYREVDMRIGERLYNLANEKQARDETLRIVGQLIDGKKGTSK